MAGFNFGFFGDQEHRVFVDGTNEKAKEKGEYVPGQHLRGAFRDGNYKRTRGAASRVQNIIGLVTLLLIAVVLVYITKFYSLL